MPIDKDTLLYDSTSYVRDVLRNNLTDQQSPSRSASNWIFESMPADKDFSAPFVILDLGRSKRRRIAQGRKTLPPEVTMEIQILAHKIDHRDFLADQVVKVLENRDSANASGTKMYQNYLVCKETDVTFEDVPTEADGKILNIERNATVIVVFKYTGA